VLRLGQARPPLGCVGGHDAPQGLGPFHYIAFDLFSLLLVVLVVVIVLAAGA
jgi:hypothetical protein